MTLHHITFVRCLVLLIPANLMTSNLRFGELLFSVGYCSRFAETRIVAYHFTLWTQLPSSTTERRAPLDMSVTDPLCFLQYYDGDILTVTAESIQQCCHSFFRHGTVKMYHNCQFRLWLLFYFIWVTHILCNLCHMIFCHSAFIVPFMYELICFWYSLLYCVSLIVFYRDSFHE